MEITVDLGMRSYPVTIDRNITGNIASILKNKFPDSRFALITNTTISSLYREMIDSWKSKLDITVHEMPDGEQYKTIDTWKGILDFLIHEKFERSSVMIALGGGVVGDVAGFAASVFLRGIPVVQIPTTLLAMVDSSIGGKTAVDHPDGKNLIGSFYQPRMVLVDTIFLDTLPHNQFISGCAELIKYAFIGGRETFNFVEDNIEKIITKDNAALLEGIARSIEIKAGVVSQDEHETKGLRALLNYGHTFAHSLERFYNFNGILHGEAVHWGMHCAFILGKRIGTINRADFEIYENIMAHIPYPALESSPDPQVLYDMMFTDKKVVSGKVRFVVPSVPGESVVRKDIAAEDVLAVLKEVFE